MDKSTESLPRNAVALTRQKRMTVADATTGQLRRAIISGQIPDGTALRQDALAAELGVSRIPVREALARLEAEGLAVSYPHRGYFVAALSRDEILELFELRTLLEPELLRAAIANMTPADIKNAEAELKSYDLDVDRADVSSWGEHNVRYHMALYEPSRHRKTLEIVRGLLVNTDRYTRMVLTLGTGVDQAKEDHGGLLRLCRDRAVNQAVALLRDHIQRARGDLLNLLESQPPKM